MSNNAAAITMKSTADLLMICGTTGMPELFWGKRSLRYFGFMRVVETVLTKGATAQSTPP
jgi:hypothetical protein